MIEKKEVEELYNKVIQEYKDNPGALMSPIFDKYLSKYNDKEVDEINEIISELMGAKFGSHRGEKVELSYFEIEVENLYKEFISSDSIESLSRSIRNLKRKIDYFRENGRKERLVMPIRDFEMLYLELDHLEYGLSHWDDIKIFILSSSNKQVDIRKGLDLDKDKLSTFFYMMDKLGFVKKETIKNRVYINKIMETKYKISQ